MNEVQEEKEYQEEVKLIECPTKAMQGIQHFIPTQAKIRYIQSLLRVGFDVIDFGSLGNTKDTKEVLENLDFSETNTQLLSFATNTKEMEIAAQYPQIKHIGFPLPISEVFQAKSFNTLQELLNITEKNNQKITVYLSIECENLCEKTWNADIVNQWVDKLHNIGISSITLSIGETSSETIHYLLSNLISSYSDIEFGTHLHTSKLSWHQKLHSAYTAGCRKFSGTIMGLGEYRVVKNELIGNMPTEKMISYFTSKRIKTNIRPTSFESAYNECKIAFGL